MMRAAALLAVCALAVVLTGCGSSKKQQPAGTSTTTTTTRATGTSQSSVSSATQSSSDAALLALRPFSAASPWNTPVAGSPVDPGSSRYVSQLVTQRIGTVEIGNRNVQQQVTTESGALYINTFKWAPPIVDVRGGRPTHFVCRQLPGNCGDAVSTLNVPTDVSPLPQYDGWFTVTDRSRGIAYDFWRARRSRDGGTISYQIARRWDLNGPGFLKPTEVSGRGSGLPLFAGVIVPQEIQAGQINHALAISLPGPARRNYVQPASRTDGIGALGSLPEGAHIRLRASFHLTKVPNGANPRAAAAIVSALKRYGAIVVDRARVPTLYAQQNFNWATPADGSAAADGASTAAISSGTAAAGTTTTNTTTTDAGGATTTDATVAPDASSPTGLSASAVTAINAPSLAVARRDVPHPIPLLQGNELQGITIADFEVVQLPAILQDPPLDVIQVSDAVTTP
jgi:hypothetical protein